MLPLSGNTGEGATLETKSQGRFLVVESEKWPNAVAYETYDSNDQLYSVSVLGTGDTSTQKNYVDFPTDAKSVYAVGYDGKKILVYPANTLGTQENLTDSGFNIYPNPITNGKDITLSLKNAKGKYHFEVYDISGRQLLSAFDTIENINHILNQKARNWASGMYIISLHNDSEKYQKKLIKQ
ncbi:T9SS type A sorting domain-containing protein [Elizabethkingia sp. JS20170427COW]|uniref:T9SS type A sorting domain-containing protein n=1 Tax=Elizabethkingia sp. JS20170427COW TaxID=2583851 RepID=UPI00143D864C|nr:T9SS type A sorting domain-containing protein [Elizabethkingia sp. JS20170427COW]